MRKYIVLLLLSSLFLLGCENVVFVQQRGVVEHPIDGEMTFVQSQIRADSNVKIEWSITKSIIPNSTDIKRVFAFGHILITADVDGGVYRSNDSGKSWLSVNVLNDYSIRDIYFRSPNEGLLVAREASISGAPPRSCVLRTRDGGLQWSTVFSTDSGLIENFSFNSSGLGIAVGRTTTFSPVADTKGFAVISYDFGQTWNDISIHINTLLQNAKGVVGNYLTATKFVDNGRPYLVTQSGIILGTNQNGTWEIVHRIQDEFDQTRFDNFGSVDNGRTWVSGGAASIEGMWGIVGFKNQTGWSMRRLRNYFFCEIQNYDDKTLIGAGWKYSVIKGNVLRTGVLLISRDYGSTWNEIYKSDSSSELNYISLSPLLTVVTGNNGEILTVTRNKK